ncbi:MAG: hypothetical protein CMO64_07445 [Verrucomicrobiales bacterium]|nr:hypothetical protein [Verrucomicrobiales bacterium]|tara:strand:+ start:2808 stop:3623 length:816 start_codon:yes stop_codon:yes gene_type:complete
MNANPATQSPARVDMFAAFRGLWRLHWQRQLAWKRLAVQFGLMGFFIFLSWHAIPSAEFHSPKMAQDVFFGWVIGFYFLTIVPLTCLNVCGSMVREEAAANTLCFFTTRPLKRSEMFLLFYLGNAAWLQLLFAIFTVLLFGIGFLHGIPGLMKLLPLMLATQFLAIMAWSALCAMLGMAHPRYIVVGILYGLLVEIGIANIPTNIHNLALSHHIQTLLSTHSEVELMFNWTPGSMPIALLCLGAATMIFLLLGAALFTWRELLPAQAAPEN